MRRSILFSSRQWQNLPYGQKPREVGNFKVSNQLQAAMNVAGYSELSV